VERYGRGARMNRTISQIGITITGPLKPFFFLMFLFAIGYAVARSFCELFREPDAQLGFLWGGLTMGTLLSLPLMLAGIALMAAAMRKETARRT
jgi:prolipoprotein diacylglyceryltransferase